MARWRCSEGGTADAEGLATGSWTPQPPEIRQTKLCAFCAQSLILFTQQKSQRTNDLCPLVDAFSLSPNHIPLHEILCINIINAQKKLCVFYLGNEEQKLMNPYILKILIHTMQGMEGNEKPGQEVNLAQK